MGNSENSKLITGLDIGSSNIKIVVMRAAFSNGENQKEIVVKNSVPNNGLSKGSISDISKTTEAIGRCLKEIEKKCGTSIPNALVSISGEHIRSFDSKTSVLVHNSEVDQSDIGRLKKEAKVISVPDKYKVLHVVPKDFAIDDEDGIVNPEGMYANKVEMNAHIITAKNTAIKNTLKCCALSNIKVDSFCLSQLASSTSVLGEDEKQLGVALVDIGGETSKILIYVKGVLVYTSMIPLGGVNVTNDIAVGLRIGKDYAEELKVKFGVSMPSMINSEQNIEVRDKSSDRKPHTISNTFLSGIIEPRAEEILSLIDDKLKSSGFINNLGSGIVITGGTSNLFGLTEMMEFMYNMKVRKGIPNFVRGMDQDLRNPKYATSVGLVLEGFRNFQKKPKLLFKNSFSKITKRLKGLVST